MPEVKRHLYLDGECKLFVENSEEYVEALRNGWGTDRHTITSTPEEEIIKLEELDLEELVKIGTAQGLRIPANIGRDTLLNKLLEMQDVK